METRSMSDSTAKISGGGRAERDDVAFILRYFALMVSCIAALCAGCGPGVEPGVGFGGYGGSCPAGQRKVCLGQCAFVQNLVGRPCDLDPCLRPGSEAIVCGTNSRCEPDAAGSSTGACRPIPTDLGVPPRVGACNPRFPLGSLQNPCGQFATSSGAPAGSVATPSFCAPLGDDLTCTPNTPTRAACNPTRVEGETCDGDWEDVISPLPAQPSRCLPCAPGFRCVNSLTGGPRVCLRRCDTGSGIGGCRTASNSDRPWTYQCQPQPWQRPGSVTTTTPVCVRVGLHGNVCGAPIASFETRDVVQIVPPVVEQLIYPGDVLGVAAEAVNVPYTVRIAPPTIPLTGCSAQCDSCVTTESDRQPTPTLLEPRCCVQPEGRCVTDSDCCAYGSFGARCVPDPQPRANLGSPPLGICRRGCNAELFGNLPADLCNGAIPSPTFRYPNFVCPGHTECTLFSPPGGTASPVCMPCGRPGENACRIAGRQGCTIALSPNQVPDGGLVRLGNLVRDTADRCQVNLACGANGGACCPANARVCGPGARLPQGDRCANAGFVCNTDTASGQCVPCGIAAGGIACEGNVDNFLKINQFLPQPSNLASNAVCAYSRISPRTGERDRCPGDPPNYAPQRCQDARNLVASTARDPYSGVPDVCVDCGARGQPCCEGGLCGDRNDTCVGYVRGGQNGTCQECGRENQPCCRCPTAGSPRATNSGCDLTNQQNQRLVCTTGSNGNSCLPLER
jgi:hypothetical protein